MPLSKIPSAGFQDNVKFRNLIINGGMDLAQRGTSASSVSTTGINTVDRIKLAISSMGTWTQSQSTDVPTGQGFTSSFKMDCTTADASPASADYLIIQQLIEGQNLQYLKKGTANAESLTLSFWVKSNKTGTYICELYDTDNARTINKSYTISSASTWEKKTLTYDGDTTSAFNNDNGTSLELNFWLGGGTNYTSGTLATSWESITNANRAVGQVNLADSTANEWYITGVQLEAGQTASEFEFLPVDINRIRCQRYYTEIRDPAMRGVFGSTASGGASRLAVWFPVAMRTAPSITISGTFTFWNGSGTFTGSTLNNSFQSGSPSNCCDLDMNINTAGTQGQACVQYMTGSNTKLIKLNSEL